MKNIDPVKWKCMYFLKTAFDSIMENIESMFGIQGTSFLVVVEPLAGFDNIKYPTGMAVTKKSVRLILITIKFIYKYKEFNLAP